ncbi:MAG: CHAP domain-containing protein [Anaeroplasmataceae bacterium]|nr:CHAP domain-containing protein [Anaeroplasmataceae bacterium]
MIKLLKIGFCFSIVVLVFFNVTIDAEAEEQINLPSVFEKEIETNYGLNFSMNTTDNLDVIYTYKGTPVEVIKHIEDYNSVEKGQKDSDMGKKFPNAEKLRPASKLYNCHSYAWYSQSESNPYWMDNPSAYYLDGSYTEVSSPKVGDIICYFNNAGTTNTTSDDINLHSGIVTEILIGTTNNVCGNSNLVMVTSKWGSYGLYRHRGDECLYTSYGGGSASYIKFYRHIHNTIYKWKNETKHFASCFCGIQELQAHAIKKGTNKCIVCGGPASSGFDDLTALRTIKASKNGSYILPNGVIVLDEKDIYAYLNGTLVFSDISIVASFILL